jgi:hypothetical protein
MNLQEKFAALPPELQEKFFAVKDAAGLDAYLAEAGVELTAEEKSHVFALYVEGTAPLQDLELENVAGGGCGGGGGGGAPPPIIIKSLDEWCATCTWPLRPPTESSASSRIWNQNVIESVCNSCRNGQHWVNGGRPRFHQTAHEWNYGTIWL